jgi:peptide/nickel transport system permease protein
LSVEANSAASAGVAPTMPAQAWRAKARELWQRFARNRAALGGLVVLVVIVVVALVGPALFAQGPFELAGPPFSPPFGRFPLGTDMLGRNELAGIVYGARTSLLIGLVATLFATLLGVVIGGIAGYFGGPVDEALMRVTEMFQTIPSFLFAILLVAILSPSIGSVILAIAVVSWPPMARLVRGEFRALRNREFVEACISMGMSDARVILLHVLPNCVSSIIVTGSLLVATAILTESALSFLGLSDPNVMSWGFMVGAARDFLQRAWWLCAIPGVAILVTVLAINLVGDGLNDALNPRLRRL